MPELARVSEEGLLVVRLRARDPRAARHAVRTLAPLVRGSLRRYLGAGLESEDLCQEVFLRFFARIDELRNPEALRAFLLGICTGVARNERRRVRVRRVVELRAGWDLPEVPSAGVAPEVRELTRRLRDLLDRARPSDRALVLMRYGEEMDLAEMAAAERLALSTVRRRLARATRHVRIRLGGIPTSKKPC